jgi:Ras-related GTP-binding protein C/D
MHSFMDFQIWDFPGQIDYFDPTFDTNQIFSELGALVWVIDAQDEYSESLNRLTTTIMNLQNTFPNINVEIFIHKIDSLNDEVRTEVRQDIAQRVGDDLHDAGYINPNVTYHMTSIYDYSIFEAFSRVVQKLIPHLDTLENMMNTLVNSSGMSKAYLFDILTKVYVASDTRPVDMEVYEMCADFIDVTVDVTDLYGHERTHGLVLGDQMEETESSITLHDGTMVYLKEMNRYLCLVTVIKNPEAKDKKGLIDYNVHCFQDSLNEVLAQAWREEKAGGEDGEGQNGEGGGREGQPAQNES